MRLSSLGRAPRASDRGIRFSGHLTKQQKPVVNDSPARYFAEVLALLVWAFMYFLKNAMALGQASRVAYAFSPNVWCSRNA